jgi:hypothetical protein
MDGWVIAREKAKKKKEKKADLRQRPDRYTHQALARWECNMRPIKETVTTCPLQGGERKNIYRIKQPRWRAKGLTIVTPGALIASKIV